MQSQLQAIQRELALHARIMRLNICKAPSVLQPTACSSMMPSIVAPLPPQRPPMFEGVVPLSATSRAAAAAAAAVSAAALDAAEAGFEHCRKAPLPLPDEKRYIHMCKEASPPPPQLASVGTETGVLAPLATVSKMSEAWEQPSLRCSAPANNTSNSGWRAAEDKWTLVSVTCDETDRTAASPSHCALDSPTPLGASPLDQPADQPYFLQNPQACPIEIQTASPRAHGTDDATAVLPPPPRSRIPRLPSRKKVHHSPPVHADESEASTLGLSEIPCPSKLPPPPPKLKPSPSVKPYAEAPPPESIFIQIPRSWVCRPSTRGGPLPAPLSPTASPPVSPTGGFLDPELRPLLAEAARATISPSPAQEIPAAATCAPAGRTTRACTQLPTIDQTPCSLSEDPLSGLGVYQVLQERAPSGMGNDVASLPRGCKARRGRVWGRGTAVAGDDLDDMSAGAFWLTRTLQPLLCMKGPGKLMTDSQMLLISSSREQLAIEQ
jgi:hypothetical protein